MSPTERAAGTIVVGVPGSSLGVAADLTEWSIRYVCLAKDDPVRRL
jgi:hypothetical protein